MPNLVVYVPTSLWERIHDLGLDDPKVEARKVARGALEAWLSEEVRPAASDRRVGARQGSVDGGNALPETASSESRPFKPDFKNEKRSKGSGRSPSMPAALTLRPDDSVTPDFK